MGKFASNESDSAEERDDHLRILRALAAGRHPFTAQQLPKDSCYQSAPVLRALLAALAALQRVPAKRKLPPRAGEPWTADEDSTLALRFDQRMTIPDLARAHRRTAGSIGARLEKLGKIKRYVSASPEPVRTDKVRDEGVAADRERPRRRFAAD